MISRKNLLYGSLLFISLLVGFIIFLVVSHNNYGPYIKIQNYSSEVKNLSDDRKDLIESKLFEIVKLNNNITQDKIVAIKDANIRSSQNFQNYNKADDSYLGKLIVDIPSIKQSYVIDYKYSNNIDDFSPPELYTDFRCPLPSELLYGDFNCKTLLSDEASEDETNPILRYLPYSSLDFEISVSKKDDQTELREGFLSLDVSLLLTNADLKIGEEKAIELYKKEVLEFIKSKWLNINDYKVNYIIKYT